MFLVDRYRTASQKQETVELSDHVIGREGRTRESAKNNAICFCRIDRQKVASALGTHFAHTGSDVIDIFDQSVMDFFVVLSSLLDSSSFCKYLEDLCSF